MRKQTKLVAVLSAATLLAVGASMTSFAGWEKDADGIWHYYDSEDEMVSSEWRKDGSQWFYLDDDGNMLTNGWVDDEYYVGDNGAMLKNAWVKTTADEDIDDPDSDGDSWYYFDSKGKKVTSDDKKINGKTYFFDGDGKMEDGWYEDEDGDVYYLGEEDEGWRAENKWLWLSRPDEDDDISGCNDASDDICDEEGWYYFGSNGKMYKDAKKKKVNGRYYYFNEHGQMLYEWINNSKVTVGSQGNAVLDGENPGASPSDMLYMNVVEEGWRADGWYEIDGSEDTDTDNDTDWYYFEDGEAEKAEAGDFITNDGDGEAVYRAKSKIKASGNKYFCFDQYGRMQTGLQMLKDGFYYFDDNGYMKTGRVSNVEDDDDTYTFYFNTKNGGNGKGWTGEKSGYLYWNGKRLEADDDYRFYAYDDKLYLVSNSGKIQSSESKKYDIEGNGEDLYVDFGTGDQVLGVYKDKEHKKPLGQTIKVSVPSIALYDHIWEAKADGVVSTYANDGSETYAEYVLGASAGADRANADSDGMTTISLK